MDYLIMLSFAQLIYTFLLSIVFFSKERINKKENNIYSYLLIETVALLSFGIILYFMMKSSSYTMKMIMNKLYLFFNLLWTYLFTLYILSTLYSEKLFNSKSSTIRNILIGFFQFILIMVLPLNFTINDNGAMFAYGISTIVTYFLSFIYVIILIYVLLSKIKFAKQSKYIPLYLFFVLGTFCTIIQAINPALFLVVPLEALLTAVMYFTIENPDAKMIEQLNKARDEAVKANQAKTDFLSSMSHEIRTPLNAICGFSNSLLENDGVSDDAKGDVKNIIMASDTLLELVNGILDISKIEANKLEIIDSVYSFKKMYEELILLTKARIGEKPIEFKHSYDESIPEFLYGDGIRVKQVIINLLTNSAKYTKDGYIDFRINSIQKNNIIRLIISVEDSGIGIKKESIDKLFTKFERLGVEKQTTTEGTGLGLAITKKLVEMMGGKIVVQSIYGKGSIFTISLDQRMLTNEELIKVMKEKETEEKTDEIIDASGKNILVVDDNMLNLKVAERLLKAYKCNITLVSSGSECLDKVSNNKYDLILLDDMMPRMSGTETLQKLKEIETFNTPVVALTANAITGMKEEYINRGFNDYLSKPIIKEDLNRVMKKYLKK
ncbi:putative two-component system hybrid sensor and regulator [Clostridium sp. CAG:524]|nr:putative two-component system hybrid sensor and regulator [Clostridium sp. CAG:524]